MNNRTNIICLLLAVAGLSFGIGQTVGQDRAEAGAQAARLQFVKDSAAQRELKGLRSELKALRGDISSIYVQLVRGTTTNFGIESKTIRGYLSQICRNTDTAGFSSSC